MRNNWLWFAVITTGLAGTTLAGADEDGPGRGVARISVINGDVSVQRGDSGDWVAAAINAPLVVQDRVVTGPASRAEIQLDYANMIRMSSDAEVRLSELEYARYQIQIARGTVTFRVLRDSQAEVELSTPSVSVRPVRRGEYRISVMPDGSSEITVRSGEAEIFTPRGVEKLGSGRTMLARGPASDPEFQVDGAVPRDDWDRWNESRDRDLERSRSYQYVSRDIYGAEELDGYGTWVNVAPYGHVWRPVVAGGWAPYRHGRWVWVDFYGWTWVSHDPWGWAPYHYGRWFYSAPWGWCWYPGGIRARHHWSPALVAFFGFGRGVSVGIGFGNVGWVPLAPHEPFYPWYGRRYYGGFRNRTYIDNSVTIVNNTNIRNVYRNARVIDGVTSVNAGDFGRGRGKFGRASGNEIASAAVMRGQLPVAPGRESLRMTNREVRAQNLPRTAGSDQRFFSRRQTTPVDRVPFEDQRRGMEQVSRRYMGTTPGDGDGGNPRTAGSSARGGARVAGGENGTRGGARVAGDAGTGSPRVAESGQSRVGADSGRGWRRVGESPRSDASASPRVAGENRGGTRGGETGRTGTPGMTRQAGDPAARSDGSGGWRRFGQSGRGLETRGGSSGIGRTESTAPAAPGRESGTTRGQSDGWRRFGGPRTTGGTVDANRGSVGQVWSDANPRSAESSRQPGRSGSRESAPEVRGAPERRSAPQSTPEDRVSPGRSSQPEGRSRDGGGRSQTNFGGSSVSSSDGWRRFGTRSVSGAGVSSRPEASSPSRSGSESWRGFGGSTSYEPRGSRSQSPAANPRSERQPRDSSGRWGGGREAIRLSPPMVRERSAPSGSSGGSFSRMPSESRGSIGRSSRGSYGGGSMRSGGGSIRSGGGGSMRSSGGGSVRSGGGGSSRGSGGGSSRGSDGGSSRSGGGRGR